MADSLAPSTINTLRIWKSRRESRGNFVGVEDLEKEMVRRWPDIGAAERREVLGEMLNYHGGSGS